MKKNLFLFMYALLVTSCFSAGIEPGLTLLTDEPLPPPSTAEEAIGATEEKRKEGPFTPEQIITALKKAYPEKISEISYRQDDWAVKVYDRWYYWAEGRLLPEEKILQKEDFDPHVFYRYPESLPPFQEPDEATKLRIDGIVERRESDPIERDPAFAGSLWRIWDRETSWNRVKTTYFLGYKLQIHRDLLEDLAQVEEDIQRRMLVDRELSAFVKTLRRIDGYNWRRIAGTETLSVHSYGTAVDLIIDAPRGKQVYWLWTHNSGEKFYNIPYSRRFSPPESFIEAFENHGFIWGGKWLFFDTIHFEYRPEIFILNGIEN